MNDMFVWLVLFTAFVLGWLFASRRRVRRAALLVVLLVAAFVLWLYLLWRFRRLR
jgi:hypothetical protein